jgi:hypothetical protein
VLTYAPELSAIGLNASTLFRSKPAKLKLLTICCLFRSAAGSKGKCDRVVVRADWLPLCGMVEDGPRAL